MALKPLLGLLLIGTSVSIAGAYDAELSSEVSAFIPSCAQGCFKAFVQENYASSSCGTSASLQCLCSHESAANLTVGEAAAECIGGSFFFGICTADDGKQAGVAYQMCSGQISALPNTQPTPLSAAFVLGGGSVVISTSTSTTSTYTTAPISTSHGTTSTMLTTSVSSATTASSTSLVPSPTSTTTRPTETASAQTSETPTATSTSLNKGQIAGITVGVAGAIILALVSIFMARRARKRRYPGLDEEGFMPMEEKSSSGGRSAAARLTKIFHISPPILRNQRPFTPETPPSGSEYPNVDRNTIGLAISRPRSEVVPKPQSPVRERRMSKLLPPKPLRPSKPNLTLNIPTAVHPALRTHSSQPQTDRTSTMTNMTAFADLDTEAPEGGQIWRPPPSDPQSATTYYVADKWGNWVLNNTNRQSQLAGVAEAAELDTYTPLTKSPIEKQEEQAATALATAISAASAPELPMPPQVLLKPDGRDAYMSQASSVYSQNSAFRNSDRPPMPTIRRMSSSGQRRTSRSDSKASMDSATTIQSSSSAGGPFDDSPPVEEAEPSRLSTLSPVIESPRTPTGRSPVTYPKIPGRLDLATIRMVPPPKRPSFTSSPPGQPSPTLGAVVPIKGSPSAYPRPLNPRRGDQTGIINAPNLRPSHQSTGSGFSPEQPSIRQPPATPPNVPLRSEMRLSRQFPPRLDTYNLPPPPQTRASSFVSPTSAVTTSSVASSLLAKRVGNEKAAALSLENNQKKPTAAWKRHGPGGLLSPDMAAMMSPGARGLGSGGLPATPTWQPKLTPTRRGDDLFLNVQ
ncbi:hypothetical protein PFICI_07279 [Pestalotiopsis fici W106-1]|uniref:Extracellular membrane protein CFEM domain-containing protein n=1 Tax=Pestalotiopsis fici (strain W106-1 / CGMCC3.15140) TaxID=1229662 RepID=W3XA61_PESFW|nr:uncharacterized protein PFICI_07279 [Pestalotiopsis fici W106-1]ETS82277.1 hypothetical protein PFICI_07279 [Pestalotiopsis fici W106-1]